MGAASTMSRLDASSLPKKNISQAFVPSQEGFGVGRVNIFKLSRGPVTLVLSTHLAGAIYRFMYDGTDFVKPVPIVGASMQSAVALDIPPGGSAEQRNPTEAGCAELDSNKGKSSSKMLDFRASTSGVYTSTQPAYFRKPGLMIRGKGGGLVPVLNKEVVSDVIMNKMVSFVDDTTLEYVIEHVYPHGKYERAIISVVACWTPWESSSQFHVLMGNQLSVMQQGRLYVNARGLVVSNGGSKAMGIVCVSAPSGGQRSFKFSGEKTGQWRSWNHVHALRNPGTLVWRHRLYFGTLESVKRRIVQ